MVKLLNRVATLECPDTGPLDPAQSTEATLVTAVVDLLLDWDLLDIDIALTELAEWLEITPLTARRTLQRLGMLPGALVSIDQSEQAMVRIRIEMDRCPLTC
ncbi:hypothetical protein ORI20_31230 [Mycobacterium sp. CVI_P3]|uniref:Uncharacterized protein n=1 Tax=Mycobacterium pinniadriaticum TaxID=2994102 RepID=A0ABT3SNP4_9MYCO|nr:hypothetical protein [Mycobacterium pinniadriaticum]MCX2934740.1 hypothetical protein [Mycobacterium pinniadriaticum]MCX2941162.1 hypothetical protein [Mycobacterium pinniadriaticum]